VFTTCRRNKSIQLADTLALGAVVYGDKLPSQKNGFATTTQNHLNISDVGCYHYKMPGRTSLQVNQYGCRTVLQTSRLQFPVNVSHSIKTLSLVQAITLQNPGHRMVHHVVCLPTPQLLLILIASTMLS